MTWSRDRILRLVLIGLVVGFFSGLFGVGGGIVLVPLLISFAGFDHRQASATSLAAVLLTAIAGMVAYASHGSVDLIAALLLAAGAIFGSLLGTWLLHRIRQKVLRWIFVIFLVLVAVRMFFLVPDRSAELSYSVLAIVALIGLGFVTGVISGLLGVGGGVFIVPALMLIFGLGDLVAKGTSLLMIIPTAITGTLANFRRGHTDLKASALIGVVSIPASIGGAALAWAVPAALGSILFAILLVYCAIQLAWGAVRDRSSE
ncbi:MAG: sulfite exporter TauE/SafE family protein [Cryobacterium sp.]|nr:sulfite exporter TauE/SafE family protein [Cryobacterium sp.]MCO5293436.1 sulfite exporter TauE/SafE family protein [Homoserinimonas sp.]MCW5944927.1 sulfite exporter TauE/SafE family protein [Cryobacterium sp.]